MAKRAIIVGGSGQIGRAVAANLLDHGWTVVSGQRHAASLPDDLRARGVVAVELDRADPGALVRLVGAGADAVIDTVAYDEVHAAQLLALQGEVGALVAISSAGVYCDAQGRELGQDAEMPVPIGEGQRRVAPGRDSYAARKVAMEDALLSGATGALTILRPGAIHGVGCRSPREWWVLKRILDGRRRIPLAADGATRFHTSATANIAELTRVALATPGVRALNAVDPQALTALEIAAEILAAMGSQAVLAPFAGPPRRFVGYHPWYVSAPFVFDMSAAEALGYRPVADYGDTVAATCRDLAARAAGRPWREAFPDLAPYPEAMFEYDAEDAFFAARHAGADA